MTNFTAALKLQYYLCYVLLLQILLFKGACLSDSCRCTVLVCETLSSVRVTFPDKQTSHILAAMCIWCRIAFDATTITELMYIPVC